MGTAVVDVVEDEDVVSKELEVTEGDVMALSEELDGALMEDGPEVDGTDDDVDDEEVRTASMYCLCSLETR